VIAGQAVTADVSSKSPEDGELRLSGGNTDAGRVEIFNGGRWGAICVNGDGHWDLKEADVVCRQLGMRRGIGVMRMANIPDVSAIVGAHCSGNEQKLAHCELQHGSASAERSCTSSDAPPANVGVRCSNFYACDQPSVSIDQGRYSKEELRSLLGGTGHRLTCQAASANADSAFVCTVGTSSDGGNASHEEVCELKSSGTCTAVGCKSPMPFDPDFSDGVFVFQSEMQTYLRESERLRQQAISKNRTHPCASDVQVTPLGLRVPLAASDTDVASLKALYLSPIGRIFLDLDADVYGVSGAKANQREKPFELSDVAARIYGDLEKDGVARITDAGFDLPALQAAVQEAFARKDPKVTSSTNGGVVACREHLAPLEDWLRTDSTIPSAIAAYLGGSAVLHGYKAVHIPPSLTTDSFVSAHWHHDRAGRRLKMFILLHDVDSEEGHPTQVAKGSHDIVYYWHEEFAHSRYTDAYIQSAFEIERLAGRAGEVYIFDTNSVHKATPQGSRERDVVVVEFHHAAKCGIIDSLGLNVPCPSGDQRPLNWETTASKGVTAIA
jgi:hypothetical protein